MIVVRYAEVFLKGGNRGFFESLLVESMRRALRGIDGVKIQRVHGRIFVECPPDETARAGQRLARVFGVQSLSVATPVARDLDAIAEAAIAAARAARGKPTFKIHTHRADKKFPLTSTQVSSEIGGRVHQATGLTVDVHHPELTIGVEIDADRTFVFPGTIAGPGGLPVGSTGRVELLLSGGIDSPVAGWLAMKRGCRIGATYFHSFPFTGDKTKEKVLDLARLLAGWQTEPARVNVVHFTEVQKRLREAGPGEYAVVLYRRMMMRAASALARAAGAQALVTGENLGQVASQTLENLTVIEEAATLPVLRPLVTYDKVETIRLARQIGTFETSTLPYEDCCQLFVPSHPATKAKLAKIRLTEAKLDLDAMVSELVEKTEKITA